MISACDCPSRHDVVERKSFQGPHGGCELGDGLIHCRIGLRTVVPEQSLATIRQVADYESSRQFAALGHVLVRPVLRHAQDDIFGEGGREPPFEMFLTVQAALHERWPFGILSQYPQPGRSHFKKSSKPTRRMPNSYVCVPLSPDRIPEELIVGGAIHWTPLLQQAATDSLLFNQMIEELLKFSLVKRLAEDRMLSIHRLVQVVQMDRMEPEAQRQWAERIVRAVNTVFPPHPKEDISSWPQCIRYLEQAQVCDTLIQQYLLTLPEAADLLLRTGTYLREHASYTLAEPLLLRALAIREQHLEPIASSLNNLGFLYWQQGDYERAEPLFQRALAIREQRLGPEHPDTAMSLSNLAALYARQDKYERAESLYQRALSIWEQHLGPEHLYTALGLHNLASLYGQQGKYEQAEPLLQRAITIREGTLDPSHPDLADTWYEFAILRQAQGRSHEALSLYQRTLAAETQVLGAMYPKTIRTRERLVALLHSMGRTEEAAALQEEQDQHSRK